MISIVDGEQTPAGSVIIITGNGLTSIVTWLLTATGVVVQLALLVRTTVILSPFFKVVVVNTEDAAPGTSVPFTCHWYAGADPPLSGVAVNVTEVPEQIVVVDAVILTAGVTDGVIVIVKLCSSKQLAEPAYT